MPLEPPPRVQQHQLAQHAQQAQRVQQAQHSSLDLLPCPSLPSAPAQQPCLAAQHAHHHCFVVQNSAEESPKRRQQRVLEHGVGAWGGRVILVLQPACATCICGTSELLRISGAQTFSGSLQHVITCKVHHPPPGAASAAPTLALLLVATGAVATGRLPCHSLPAWLKCRVGFLLWCCSCFS